jgi:hypothetical protein
VIAIDVEDSSRGVSHSTSIKNLPQGIGEHKHNSQAGQVMSRQKFKLIPYWIKSEALPFDKLTDHQHVSIDQLHVSAQKDHNKGSYKTSKGSKNVYVFDDGL